MASFLCSGALSGSMVKASLGVSAVGYFVNILFLRRVRVGGLVAVQQSQGIFNCRMLWKKYHQNRHSGGWDELPGILPGRRLYQLIKRAVATRWRTNE